jgi:hypothetical protein
MLSRFAMLVLPPLGLRQPRSSNCAGQYCSPSVIRNRVMRRRRRLQRPALDSTGPECGREIIQSSFYFEARSRA